MRVSFVVAGPRPGDRAWVHVSWPPDLRLPVVGDYVSLVLSEAEAEVQPTDFWPGPQPNDGEIAVNGAVTDVMFLRERLPGLNPEIIDPTWSVEVKLKW